MFAGQLLASWVPDVSYSIFLFVGPAGAGKTSAARESKNILDPESGQVDFGGKKNQSVRDLFVSASKRRVLTQDNVKDINDEKSNAYCVIASGASDDERALYTDSGEVSLFAHCALIVTAVEDNILRRSDLLDRGSFFELTPPKVAVDDAIFKARADAIRPKIVGGLLSGLAAILPIYDPAGNGGDSRMAATVAALRAIDKLFSPPGGAEAAYREMRTRAAWARECRGQAVHPCRPSGRRQGSNFGGWFEAGMAGFSDRPSDGSKCEADVALPSGPQRSPVAGRRNSRIEDPQRRAGRARTARG